MIKFKSFYEIYRDMQKEDAPATNTSSAAMPPTMMRPKKMDRRSKYHVEKMYKKALGKK